ncbi:MAG: substrate-binding domain-containing protein, partial [Flavisolibacter sp.]|nr:substrate-binding domain-containing protein [Flavisolibacter sp.]
LGAFKATQHLIDQGCRRIAHIAGQQHVAIFKKRLKGYMDCLQENKLPIDKSLIKYGKVTIQSGMECMNELLQQPQPPDGVFAVEDFTALGAMQSLKNFNKKIPDEVALIGFANEAFGKYITPSLSTVDQQTIKMGEEAAHLFFELAGTKSYYTSNPRKTILEPVLIYRESSLRKKNGSE